MTALPDPTGIDFAGIAAWGAGVTTVVVTMVGAAWLAVRNAFKVAEKMPAPVMTEKTRIITTDSAAMDRLTAALEAANVILTENNILRREEHGDRENNRRTLAENTEMLERALNATNEARADIRELNREIVRLGSIRRSET